MASTSVTRFSELLPELFHLISAHLPLVYRPFTLLSLALTCRRFHDFIIPHLLYKDVRLFGEDQAVLTLNALLAKARLVTEEDIQKKVYLSPSHRIRHLCIDSSITTPIRTPDHSLTALHKLIDVDGLQHLSALTLHINGEWDGANSEDGSMENFLRLPSSFCSSLTRKCPNLKRIYLTDMSQEFGKEWMEPELFSIESLTDIRVEGLLHNYPTPTVSTSQLSPKLHTLELRLRRSGFSQYIDATGPGGLLSCVFPNLRTLILDDVFISDAASANNFWMAPPRIERLEIGRNASGGWFDTFEVGMLQNLRYLQCNINYALVILPQVSKAVVRVSLLDTYNAQGPYLLRAVPEGTLPSLRSLSIHRDSGNSPKIREGHRWREEENGDVSEADFKKPARQFDGNHITSISKATPNLEELELMGTSDDTLNPVIASIQDSITNALSRIPKLQRLTISGPINNLNKPFLGSSYSWADYESYKSAAPVKIVGKYTPQSFEEAARDLANGCRTLDTVTVGNMVGDLLIKNGLSARIVRECEGGAVKEIRRIRAWGNVIGREEEW